MHCFLYVCMDGCDLIKIQISATIQVRVMKSGQNVDVDDQKVALEGQGHRSRSLGPKPLFLVSFDHLTGNLLGQVSHG